MINKNFISIFLQVFCISLIFIACKKEEPNYYEFSNPSFFVYQKAGEPQSIYSYSTSHDIYIDSILVTNPLNIKSMQYYHGKEVLQEVHFLIGDNFVYSPGKWTFLFYGRRVVNDLSFKVYLEKEL